MAQRSNERIALTVLVIAEVPNFWSGFLPSLFTIATFSSSDPEKAKHTTRWIRRGEMQAAGLSLALGVSASLLAEEAWPFVGTVAMIAYLAWQYETALRQGLREGPGLSIEGQ